MLPKLNRLKNKEDFLSVRKSGKIAQGDTFAAAYLSTNTDDESRFGFVV